MEKKTKIQIFLFALLILFIYLIFSTYYVRDNIDSKSNAKNTNKIDKDKNDIIDNGKDLIENIKYISNNNNGDVFQIFADYGEVSIEDPDLMFLTNVKGYVIFEDKANVELISKFANFNTKTFETTFINNVKVSRDDEIITGNELYLVLDKDENVSKEDLNKEKNLLRMSQNVIFKKPGYSLKADVFEIDLITKNSKIYMNDGTNKIIGSTILK